MWTDWAISSDWKWSSSFIEYQQIEWFHLMWRDSIDWVVWSEMNELSDFIWCDLNCSGVFISCELFRSVYLICTDWAISPDVIWLFE
jgi:hypothetical protein